MVTQTKAATKRRYYCAPTVDASVSLDEFDDDDIIEYCRHNNLKIGASPSQQDYGDGAHIAATDLARIDTLAICGQRQEARDYLCQIVGTQIGRAL